MRGRFSALLLSSLLFVACGGGTVPLRSALNARQALTAPPELLEFESASTRQELFREVARISEQEAGQAAKALVLFPISQNGALVAGRGFEARTDLLQTTDARTDMQVQLNLGAGEAWSELGRESLQGLSERELAELVGRTLLAHWDIAPAGVIRVERAEGAPYAAAYVDGVLRINPSFLYLAAAAGPASAP